MPPSWCTSWTGGLARSTSSSACWTTIRPPSGCATMATVLHGGGVGGKGGVLMGSRSTTDWLCTTQGNWVHAAAMDKMLCSSDGRRQDTSAAAAQPLQHPEAGEDTCRPFSLPSIDPSMYSNAVRQLLALLLTHTYPPTGSRLRPVRRVHDSLVQLLRASRSTCSFLLAPLSPLLPHSPPLLSSPSSSSSLSTCRAPGVLLYELEPKADLAFRVSKRVPEVAGLPPEFRQCPWKAPRAVQEAAGCVIGEDYAHPLGLRTRGRSGGGGGAAGDGDEGTAAGGSGGGSKAGKARRKARRSKR